MMKSSNQALNNRGYIDKSFESKYVNKTTKELLKQLQNNNSQDRTVAANILGLKKGREIIPALCQALTQEKKIYTKIAICNALVTSGTKAIPCLIKLLGLIGNNQYQELPNTVFKKKNYPLPRDIAARSIIKFGVPALPYLERVLLKENKKQILEAIDAIGYIAFYTKNKKSLPILKQCFKKYVNDELITWKIIRALESYPDKSVRMLLQDIERNKKNHVIIRLEAKRSLKQFNINK